MSIQLALSSMSIGEINSTTGYMGAKSMSDALSMATTRGDGFAQVGIYRSQMVHVKRIQQPFVTLLKNDMMEMKMVGEFH